MRSEKVNGNRGRQAASPSAPGSGFARVPRPGHPAYSPSTSRQVSSSSSYIYLPRPAATNHIKSSTQNNDDLLRSALVSSTHRFRFRLIGRNGGDRGSGCGCGGGFGSGGGGEEQEDGGAGGRGRQRPQLPRARVGRAARGDDGRGLRARRRPRQAGRARCRHHGRRRRRRGRGEVRGGRPAPAGRGRRREGAPPLRGQLGAGRGGGARRGAEVRPLQRRREARRRPARRRQPRLRRHQEGISWERERLLRPPRALLRHDSEGDQAQEMIGISPVPRL